jgi:hypothetical protein
MTNKLMLGRLERLDPRAAWDNEATDFTPWLAQTENVRLLADTLGVDLEVEATERQVGPFRADILCRDVYASTDEQVHWVLIENQLEPTDHKHLGQLLTYAAGLDAVTIVWIAPVFTDEHRAALDWLNRVTDSSCRFFGLEIELWRIGDSPAAPKFNVVSKPNDWTRSVAEGSRGVKSPAATLRQYVRDYWSTLVRRLEEEHSTLRPRRTTTKPWLVLETGLEGCTLSADILEAKNAITADLVLMGDDRRVIRQRLQDEWGEIEADPRLSESTEPLVLRPAEQPKGQAHCGYTLGDLDPRDTGDWGRQHAWLQDRLERLERALVPRVSEILSTLPPESPGPVEDSHVRSDSI